MGGSLRQLTSRQLERLKSELAEVIIANFCYPAFLDYRLNALRTRPVDRRKRQEVWAYVSGINFHPLEAMDASSMDFRRFVERVFLRYIDLNRALMATASARQVAAVRARVPQLALSVARGLADYLVLGETSTFGQARLVESWGASRNRANDLSWEQIEKSTQVLQTTLTYLRTARSEPPAPMTDGPARAKAAAPDISDFPTRMLAPRDEHRLGSLVASNGTGPAHGHAALENHAAANGTSPHGEEQAQPLSLPLEEDAGARGQFRGPRRSPTASRPIERSVSRPVAPLGDMPGQPKETTSRPMQWPAAPQSLSDARPVPDGRFVPGAQPEEPPDVWQSLLMRGEAEPPAPPAPPAPAAEDTPAPAIVDEPYLELPDLPESFGAPHLVDLPPDLAELYGDYLRDARSPGFDLATLSPEETPPGEAMAVSLPPSQTDEEVDALFTALTNHLAAAEARAERATPPPQPITPQEQFASEAGSSLSPRGDSTTPTSAPLAARPEAQKTPASGQPAKGMTDGDVMIFSQLQHQISTWVKMAAVSHQIDLAGRNAAELVEELRRIAALEEAELQVIESLVTLCARVTSTKQATIEDYKQAMMLYLLHHRSRLAL